jgi:thioredoxin
MEKLIDEKTAEILKGKFAAEMKEPVDIKVFSAGIIIDPSKPDAAEINEYAKNLVDELHQVDPRILPQHLSMDSPIAKELKITTSPTILIGYDSGYRIIYNGAPLGQEATGFIETICLVSGADSRLNQYSRKIVALIDKPVLIQTFVTPTCPYCVQAVTLANQTAVEARGRVTSECVESMENQEFAKMNNVSSVPHQMINRDPATATIGALPEKSYIMNFLKFAAPDKYTTMAAQEESNRQSMEKLQDNPEGVIYLSDNNFEAALKKYDNLVVDFWAEWCNPCKMLGPIVEQLAVENKGRIVFGKLNVDENQVVAGKYAIQSIPAIIFIKKGEKAGESVGVVPKQQLLDAIVKALKI